MKPFLPTSLVVVFPCCTCAVTSLSANMMPTAFRSATAAISLPAIVACSVQRAVLVITITHGRTMLYSVLTGKRYKIIRVNFWIERYS